MAKKDRTRAIIMHSAKKLFEEKTIEGVTFADIAASAKVCRATVFNHFAALDELFLAICDEEIGDLVHFGKQSSLKGAQLVYAVFCKLIEDTVLYPALTTRLTNHAILSGEGREIAKIEKIVSDALIYENTLSPLAPLKTMSPEELTQIVFGLYYGIVNHLHLNKLPFDTKEISKKFAVMLSSVLGKEIK